MAYATADGTAKAGSDYVAIPATPLAFTPGQTEQSVAVTVDPEPQDAASKSFTVNLLPADDRQRHDPRRQATITIDNPNPQPTVSIAGAAVTASPTGPTTATFTVSLSEPSACR